MHDLCFCCLSILKENEYESNYETASDDSLK